MAFATIGTAGITDGAIATADIADNAVTSAKTSGIPARPNAKPLIINGNMAVAQRGTSSSSTGYQTVDRWRLNTGTQQEQKTDAPDNFSHSMEVTGTTGGSSGYGIIYQRLESKDILATLGKTCTLSAYVKNTGTSTANVSCEIYRANATDNWSGQTLVSSLTAQAITTSWTQIVFPSFSVPTTASTGLEVRIFRYDGSNDQEWLITGVQLEVGDYTSSTLTPFQHESYGDNLQRCKRYYETQTGFYFYSFQSGTNVVHDVPINCKVEKRATPTGSFSGSVVSYYPNTGGANSETNNVTAITIGDKYGSTLLSLDTEAQAPTTAGYHPIYADARNAVANWDAEL